MKLLFLLPLDTTVIIFDCYVQLHIEITRHYVYSYFIYIYAYYLSTQPLTEMSTRRISGG